MAKLPPKSPSQNGPLSNSLLLFPNYQQQQQQQMPPPSAGAPTPFWVDEFLDFSSSRRNSHRRSVSDPIAFAEIDDTNAVVNNLLPANKSFEFERLDDEQLSSMFSDVDVPPPNVLSPSTLSDQSSSANDDNTMKLIKTELGSEVQSQCQTDHHKQLTGQPSGTVIVDPKRVKRILANRQSARRSRVRKLQYISELERSVTSLQGEVSSLSPRVAFLDHQRLILNVDNTALKQRIAALLQDKLFKDAHQEALKKELERLRQIYHEQNLSKKMDNNNNNNNNNDATNAPPPLVPSATNNLQH